MRILLLQCALVTSHIYAVCRQEIFTIISAAACITNAALSVMTMDVLNNYSDMFRMWFFVLFQWICFLIQVHYPRLIYLQYLKRDSVGNCDGSCS